MGLLRRLSRWVISLAQRAVIAVLRAGPMPAHIAFVMDGNRRYATSHGLDATAGHGYGYTALERVLEICARLEIRCVSVYAFSIDNFKRAPGEVTTLMGLAEDKLRELARHGALFDKYNIRLNVCGRKEMLPPAVQEAVRWAEERTKHHDRAILNLCMPYTSRDEMTTAVEKAVQATLDQGLDPKTITPDTIAAHLMTSPSVSGSPPLDILVRTSGVSRLSDFLLWQSHKDVQLQFSRVYWPDFGLKELVPILLDFQRRVWSSPSMHQKERRRRLRLLDDEAEGMIRDYKRKLA